jgi:F-type H+-transporting ATPase subunit epsilon
VVIMTLPESIQLEIVTPESQLYSGHVHSVTVPSTLGYLGILPGHAPLLAELGIGEISFAHYEGTGIIASSWGFVEVLPDRVVILAQTAELAEQIDVSRAERAKVRAEKLLASKDPNIDFARAQLAVLRAVARLSVASKGGRSSRF